jgi:hypothetical protein
MDLNLQLVAKGYAANINAGMRENVNNIRYFLRRLNE